MRAGQDQDASSALSVNSPLILSAWKGRATLAIMADKAETSQMLDKIVSVQVLDNWHDLGKIVSVQVLVNWHNFG